MKIGFIGAGKVGFSLGKYFVEKSVHVIGYYSRHKESADAAATFTDTGSYDNIADLVRACDAIFITVPDGQIRDVYEQIRNMELTSKHICHCSGAMSSKDAFYDLEERGAYGYSIHPLFPISSRYEAYRNLADAFICIEGDARGIEAWAEWFRALGNPVRVIGAERKVTYHAACAIASNLVCGLMSASVKLLGTCGFTESQALEALRPLAGQNLSAIFSQGVTAALTGPVERGDAGTVEKHLASMDDEQIKAMYLAVSRCLVDIAEEKHPEQNYHNIRMVLEEGT